jgi:hypothetical protein
MPTPTIASVLGSSYLDKDFFIANARTFGVQALIGDWSSNDVLGALTNASRMVDAFTRKSFDPAAITEQHNWNPGTRRTKVNQPPIMELISYQIRTSPGTVSTFELNTIYINNQENYVELASLSLAGSLTSQMISLGMTTPIVEITYKSYQSVPSQVAAAVGFTAADIINRSASNDLLPAGLASVKDGDMAISRHGLAGQSETIPDRAKDLLQIYSRIAVA